MSGEDLPRGEPMPVDGTAPPELAAYSHDEIVAELVRRNVAAFVVLYPPPTPDDPSETCYFYAPASCDLPAMRKRLRRLVGKVLDDAARTAGDADGKKENGT